MKTSFRNPFSGLQFPALSLYCSAFTIAISVFLDPAQGAALTWDTILDDGSSITPGNGTWNTTNITWNNGTTNVAWQQTNPTTPVDRAILGGVDGTAADTYIITLASQIASSGLKINNSGYKLDGTGTLYLRNNSATGTGFFEIVDGKTLTIACPISGPANVALYWLAGENSTVNIIGNSTANLQPNFVGKSGTGTQGTFNFGGTHSYASVLVNAKVNVTGSATFSSSTSLFVGRGGQAAVNLVPSSTGTLTLDGVDAVLNHNGGGSGNNTMIGRGDGTGILAIKNGTFNTATTNNTHDVAIAQDNNAATGGTFDVQGGTVNIGSTTNNTAKIHFGRVGLGPNQSAIMTQSGGTINSHGGILFGGATAGTYSGTANWTMTGGTLYLGAGGISEGTLSPTEIITLSGGTIGTLANWTGSLPMALATTKGDTTFRCADSFSNPFNISLTKALTGLGGLKKTGAGKLTLSGVNRYSGTTLVSDGTLEVVTGVLPSTNGPLTLNGSTGSPIVAVNVSNVGQTWNVGDFICTAGTPIAELQYGVLSPSSDNAPIQVTGNVDFSTTPLFTIGGAAIGVGTYPLIQYTGTFSGTAPTTVSLPAYCAGMINHNTATKTIELVIETSTFVPSVSWAVGDGVWDINTTPNWQMSGNPVNYNNGDSILLDDTASGTSPITISLNTTVSPSLIKANATKNYVLSGTGSISGTGSVNLLGAGSLTLSGLNTYSGGTTLNAGQLNINSGGTASGSAMGTGMLTINQGAALDNTSGSDVTVLSDNVQQWNGNFSYIGSANDLNTGLGLVNLGNNIIVNVAANTLTVAGQIMGDYRLTKTGTGILSLTAENIFSGGLTLLDGGLNVADSFSAGTGVLTLGGGTLDNISGGELGLSPSGILLGSSFTFAGTNNLSLTGTTNLLTTNTPTAVNVLEKTLTFDGPVFLGNAVLTKNGAGTLAFSGSGNSSGGLTIDAGRVHLDKSSGFVVTTNQNVTVNSGGVLALTGSGTNQIEDNAGPMTLAGGTFDLNGRTETINTVVMSNGGTVRNSAAASNSSLNFRTTTSTLTLNNIGNFDVTAVDSNLNITGLVVGSGNLRKTGTGTLTLSRSNTYSGTTAVEFGNLAVTGSLGATAVTVSNGAILSGNGNIGGNVTIQSGGSHALAVAATSGQQVTRVIGGTLTLDTGNVLNLNAQITPASGIYELATAATITGSPSAINFAGAGVVSVDTVSIPNRLLLTVSGGSNFDSWANDPTKGNIPGEPASGDFDFDGVSNLVEYALGLNPRVSSLPAGILSSNLITYTKGVDAIANGDVSWVIETSASLTVDSWTAQVTQTAGNTSMTIAYSFTPGSPAKNFARLKVTKMP